VGWELGAASRDQRSARSGLRIRSRQGDDLPPHALPDESVRHDHGRCSGGPGASRARRHTRALSADGEYQGEPQVARLWRKHGERADGIGQPSRPVSDLKFDDPQKVNAVGRCDAAEVDSERDPERFEPSAQQVNAVARQAGDPAGEVGWKRNAELDWERDPERYFERSLGE
jgi:hypothetical protein